MTIYTYSQLGVNGACGNQLWQIAGTVGKALDNAGDVRLPAWDYAKYFSLPDEMFESIPQGEEIIDLSPDYLQDYNIWAHHDIIPDIFAFSPYSWDLLFKNYGDLLSQEGERVSVHVRRANNLQLPDHHPVCPLEYFEVALDIAPEAQVVVFSDDVEWCKKQSLFKDAFFAKGNDKDINVYDLTGPTPLFLESVMLDLILMAQCDYQIISNSSFSWWGAYLSYSPLVIYPSRWYGKKLRHINTEVMFPPNWKKLDLTKW